VIALTWALVAACGQAEVTAEPTLPGPGDPVPRLIAVLDDDGDGCLTRSEAHAGGGWEAILDAYGTPETPDRLCAAEVRALLWSQGPGRRAGRQPRDEARDWSEVRERLADRVRALRADRGED